MLADQPVIISPISSSSFDTETMYTIPFHPSRPDPQKSDIFSLGCIFLDIVTMLMKRPSRSFSSHRSAKNKTPGRGGGLPDSSFHKNLGQVETWIGILAKDASKKEDKIFRGVSHILQLVTRMLSVNPADRPDAQFVLDRLHEVLTRICGIEDICCSVSKGHVYSVKPSSWPLGSPGIPVIEGQAQQEHRRSGSSATTLNDSSSMTTTRRSSSGSGEKAAEGKRSMNASVGMGKVTPKARAWQAPVYAG
jgi:serine/threonine protein kinase